MSGTLFLMGIFCLASPIVESFIKYGDSPDPFMSYLASRTLHQILLIKGMTMAGLFLINSAFLIPN